MKISDQTINDSTLQPDNESEEQKKSDRFLKVLKKDDGKERQEAKDKSKDPASLDTQYMPLTLTSTEFTPVPLPQPSAVTHESGSTKDIPNDQHVERLADELGRQIELLKSDGRTNGINITFSSRTLDGLHVQVRQQDGGLAIRFVTQSEGVSKLLTQHTDQLRDALASKGVKVRNVSISNSSHRLPVEKAGSNAGT
ncbi:MAG TPA: flagellar hook-length control protein FliK [Bryobacteraceae bacterium]|jgi:flagellar hook-length control protein FliK|nr:flagellar hook-length control protein FliK [Bryobacteraceae bacterium]